MDTGAMIEKDANNIDMSSARCFHLERGDTSSIEEPIHRIGYQCRMTILIRFFHFSTMIKEKSNDIRVTLDEISTRFEPIGTNDVPRSLHNAMPYCPMPIAG